MFIRIIYKKNIINKIHRQKIYRVRNEPSMLFFEYQRSFQKQHKIGKNFLISLKCYERWRKLSFSILVYFVFKKCHCFLSDNTDS